MAHVPIDVPSKGIDGEFRAGVVDASGAQPNDVIRVSDTFRIDCTWHVNGALARMLCGNWHVRVAFESVGPGPEFFTKEITVPIDSRKIGPGNPYTAQFVFPGGPNFPGATPPNPRPKIQPEGIGVYEVAVILTCTDKWGNPIPIAASKNLEKLTIFDDN